MSSRGHTPPVWVMAGLVILLPIIYDPAGWQSYLPAKWAVASVLAFAGVAALALPSFRGSSSPSRVSLPVPVWIGVGFLGLGLVVGIDAVDPLAHWIGTPERRLGWLAFLAFFLLFLTGTGVANRGGRRLISRAAVVALLVLGGHGGLQMLGLIGDELERITATMGSAAYLGAVLCLLLPLGVGLILDREEHQVWRVSAVLGVALGIVVALGSQTRAAWVGLGLAAVMAVVTAPKGRARYLAGGGLAMLVLLVALSPVGERFVEVGQGEATGRLDEWATALDVIALDPLTGMGFEGYRVAFPQVVSADYVRSYGRDVVTDRAHNGILDVAVTTGVVGGTVYLVAMFWVVSLGWRTLRLDDPVLAGMGVALIAYVVQQQFLFPLMEVDPIFWGLTGSVWAGTLANKSLRKVSLRSTRWIAIPFALTTLVVGVLGIAADRTAAAALNGNASGNHVQAVKSARRARSLRPDSFLLLLVEAEVLLASDNVADTKESLGAIEDALALAPQDPILIQRRAEVMLKLSGVGVLTPGATMDAFRLAVGGDPNNPVLLLGAGTAASLVGDVAAAEMSWVRASELDPDNPDPLRLLARLYENNDQPRAAASMRARADTLETKTESE